MAHTRVVRHPQPDPVGPGQESVWNYPRPPSAEVTGRRIEVVLGGQVIATGDGSANEEREPDVTYEWTP